MTYDDQIRALEAERITWTPDRDRPTAPDRSAVIDQLLGQCIATLAPLMAEDHHSRKAA